MPNVGRLRLALIGALASTTLALQVKQPSDDEVDHYGHSQVKPKVAFVASALTVTAATGLQVLTPGWLKNTLGEAACSGGVGAVALKCAEVLQATKKSNPLGLVLGHGIITKACADVLAQTIPHAEKDKVWLDPLRVFRSMLASVLSTSIPFYYWTSFMAANPIGTAPGWVTKLLTKGFGTATWKTIVTQVLFRPFNVLFVLILQSVFRGDTARQLQGVLKQKFKSSVIGGVVFYSISNLAMYSVPVPFLWPIMGSVAGLVFNTWLAIVAYKK